MNLLGIITEYNPFHNGHLYHLRQSIKKTKPDGIICVMNGHFVQRGLPALLNKWARTKMALDNGVDLVIELPLIFGIRSAEYFACGAIQLLNATGLVDSLVFGSESGDLTTIKKIADILISESPYFQERLRKHLTEGNPFPRARELALYDHFNLDKDLSQQQINSIQDIIAKPNNILAIEYLKALTQTKSSIKALTIKRSSNNYHQKEFTDNYASATSIREKIKNNQNLESLKDYLPLTSWQILKNEVNQGRIIKNSSVVGQLILSRLRALNPKQLQEYEEIDNGLENRIIEAAHHSGSLSQLIGKIKTRAYTQTRIQRNLLHILFGLDRKEFKTMDQSGAQYIRILGFTKKGEEIVSALSKNSSLPLVLQPADYLQQIDFTNNNPLIKSLSYDILATDIYSLFYPVESKRKGHLDFTTPIIKM